MGYLLEPMTPERVNGQRDVVKNERRQSYENAPYGKAFLRLSELLYPPNHPYEWSTIGSMEDLSAASYEDVVTFFKTYYVPNNASLVVAGDLDIAETRRLVEKWFSEIPRGPDPPPIVAPACVVDRCEEGDADRQGAIAASLSRVAYPGRARAGRCDDGYRVESPDRRKECPVVQAARLRDADRAGREPRVSNRRRSAASS